MKFVNPNMLYALFLIAIPVIIHLFNLKRHKIVYFTNVKFLRELKEETQKKSVLKHLLVLLARIMAIVFLVMAFARPYIPAAEEMVITDRDFISFYVDNSFSMQAEGRRGTLLDMAKRKATEISAAHRNTDAFQVLSNELKGEQQRLVAIEDISSTINSIDYAHYNRSFSEILARQKSLASSTHAEQNIFYIASDFQKTMFDYDNLSADTSLKVVLIPVNAENIDNVYIDSCWFESPVMRLHQDVVLNVRIKNSSGNYIERAPVKLMLNEQQRALASFNCQPYSSTIVSLPFKINRAGIHNGYVEIMDYPITYDDKMYISFNVYDEIKILCINKEKENLYINTLFRNDSAFIVDNVSETNIDYSKLPAYNLIILNGFDAISSGLALEIEKYVEAGGHFLLIPSAEIDLNSYNSFFNKFGPLHFSVADTQRLKINYLDLHHPLYRNVFDDIPENVDLPEVRLHYPYSLPIGMQGEDLLKLQNGNPFLSAMSYAQGQLYLMSAPLERHYSGFPLHAVFVPTLYNMSLNSVAGGALYYRLGIDQTITLPHASPPTNELFRIRALSKDYEFIPQQNVYFSRISLNIFDQINEAGSYILSLGEDDMAGLSFNYDRTASELDFYDADALKSIVKSNALDNINVIDISDASYKGTLKEINKGVLLYKFFIILALFFLGAEILLLRLWK